MFFLATAFCPMHTSTIALTAPLVIIRGESGGPTTTEIRWRLKSKGISSSFCGACSEARVAGGDQCLVERVRHARLQGDVGEREGHHRCAAGQVDRENGRQQLGREAHRQGDREQQRLDGRLVCGAG